MNRILVTGGAGNIASALTAKLAEDPDNFVVVADNLSTGDISKVPLHFDNVRFVNSDANIFSDISALFFIYHFDYVFHFAAVVGVQRTLENPLSVLHDIRGIENILNLSKNTGVKRVYYSSSSEVYGEPFEIPQHESTTPLNSRLPYAVVKNVGEAYFSTYEHEYGLNYTIFRFFNTYGPNQTEAFVLPRFIRAAMHDEAVTIYGDGSQTRTFCYVDDTVQTCVNAHNTGAFLNDVVNVGGAEEISILNLAKRVIEVCESASELIFLPPLEEGDMTRRCPDVSKMRTILKREPVALDEGIRRLRNHFDSKSRI